MATGGRTLKDIRNDQLEYAAKMEKTDPKLAKKVREWANHLGKAIARGKELLG